MAEPWIEDTLQEQEQRQAYGKVTLHYEAGKVQRVTVEQSIKKPEPEGPRPQPPGTRYRNG